MKRSILLFLCAATAVAVFAKPPKLNVENLFDGRYNDNKNTTITIYKSNGNFYRGITVKNDPDIIKDITEAMDKDTPKASDYSDHQDAGGQRYTSLQVANNGEIIYIGLQRDKSGDGFFFIQGKEKAFK